MKRELNKKRVRLLLDYKETISEIANPFSSDLFFEIVNLNLHFKTLQELDILSENDALLYRIWGQGEVFILKTMNKSPIELEQQKRKIITELLKENKHNEEND